MTVPKWEANVEFHACQCSTIYQTLYQDKDLTNLPDNINTEQTGHKVRKFFSSSITNTEIFVSAELIYNYRTMSVRACMCQISDVKNDKQKQMAKSK